MQLQNQAANKDAIVRSQLSFFWVKLFCYIRVPLSFNDSFVATFVLQIIPDFLENYSKIKLLNSQAS